MVEKDAPERESEKKEKKIKVIEKNMPEINLRSRRFRKNLPKEEEKEETTFEREKKFLELISKKLEEKPPEERGGDLEKTVQNFEDPIMTVEDNFEKKQDWKIDSNNYSIGGEIKEGNKIDQQREVYTFEHAGNIQGGEILEGKNIFLKKSHSAIREISSYPKMRIGTERDYTTFNTSSPEELGKLSQDEFKERRVKYRPLRS